MTETQLNAVVQSFTSQITSLSVAVATKDGEIAGLVEYIKQLEAKLPKEEAEAEKE